MGLRRASWVGAKQLTCDSAHVSLPTRTRRMYLHANKSGNVVRVGILLDVVSQSTRTPHGAYAHTSKRNRVVELTPAQNFFNGLF